MPGDIPALLLKKDQDKRLRSGHCWIYSNEIDTEKTPLKDLTPGEQIALLDHKDQFLGFGYVNPHSLIAVRILSRQQAHPISQSLISHRLNQALALRQQYYAEPFYRLVFGEADGLPGLVVDRYGDALVVQLSTAGMEVLREAVIAALNKLLKPKAILLRNDSPAREQEGLERYIEAGAGQMPELLELREGGCHFIASPGEGQKTGWFFDQANNRDRLMPWVKGKRVLDLFCYSGAWGIRAAAAGASSVTLVDASERALGWAQENASRNGLEDKVNFLQGDAFDLCRKLHQDKERFDLVLVDPPAFIKRRKDQKQGEQAYRRINQAAMQLLSKDGLLVSSSCSHHLSDEGLLHTLNQAGRHLDRSLQLLWQGAQGPDHPVHPAMPETAYLKTFMLRVLPSF